MKEEYKPTDFVYSGRVDGVNPYQLRWHQMVEKIDIQKKQSYKKGFCLIGFKSDLGIKKNKGRIGAKLAPDAIRQYLASMPWHFENLGLYDCGDVICEDNLEKAHEILGFVVENVIEAGLFPIIIGGGHESAFGSVMGAYKGYGQMPSIVNFDAHFDMRDYSNGATSGTSFKQLADLCKKNKKPFEYLCLGIQKSSNTPELFNIAKSYKTRWIDMDMIRFNEKTAMKTFDEFLKNAKTIHLSLCMDVFAQSIAPGVSSPQPFGLMINEFLKFFYYIISSGKIRSFDIAEVSPALDTGGMTSALAANIVFRLVDKTAQKLNRL